jgi:hypothetical protein
LMRGCGDCWMRGWVDAWMRGWMIYSDLKNKVHELNSNRNVYIKGYTNIHITIFQE